MATALVCSGILSAADPSGGYDADAAARIGTIEARLHGRLGVAAFDTGTKRWIQHRSEERFPLCSTFKLALVGAVLHRVDAGTEKLDRVIAYTAADLLEYAPVTREHVGEGGMTVEALCAAAIEQSDNTAANLLLATVGDPAGLTTYLRTLGDEVSRLDRVEPALNETAVGDLRDSTSPSAMLGSVRALLLGDALTSESRAKLDNWLTHNTTGAHLIRAGVPPGWQVGDKTGRGGDNTINDIAIIHPKEGAPILLCIYFSGSKALVAEREAAVAETARIVCEAFQ
ncbi:MAG: class A beta-lactamase [Verrucomicrobiota bacterium]|nr:class A beta-lactamase [Verrucomicrobiota bacterium]